MAFTYLRKQYALNVSKVIANSVLHVSKYLIATLKVDGLVHKPYIVQIVSKNINQILKFHHFSDCGLNQYAVIVAYILRT